MAELQVEFSEAEMKHLNPGASGIRQRYNTRVGYDAEELRPLSEKSHNVYKDMRTDFPSGVPSLSLWALAKPDPTMDTCSRANKQRITKFVFETLASLIFVWFVVFSVWVKTDVIQESGGGEPVLLSIQSLYTGFIQAFGLGLALVACGYFSAELNPMYTLVTSFFPRPGDQTMGSTAITGLVKIVGQHLGAFLGALLAYAVLGHDNYPGTSPASTSGYGVPGVPGSPNFGFGYGGTAIYEPTLGQAFVFEMLGSFQLGLLMMIIQFNPPSMLTKYPHITLPFTLLALVTFGCPITGAVFNFARYFGQAIVAAIFGSPFGAHWWVYLLSSLVGMGEAALLYIFVFRF